jgi:hypothetical protein
MRTLIVMLLLTSVCGSTILTCPQAVAGCANDPLRCQHEIARCSESHNVIATHETPPSLCQDSNGRLARCGQREFRR